MSKLSEQTWWVKAQLSMGHRVLVLCPARTDVERMVEQCSPPGVPYLVTRNIEGMTWDVVYDNGALLSFELSSHRIDYLSTSVPVRRSNGHKGAKRTRRGRFYAKDAGDTKESECEEKAAREGSPGVDGAVSLYEVLLVLFALALAGLILWVSLREPAPRYVPFSPTPADQP